MEVERSMNAFVKKSGDSMTGTLLISGTGGGGGGTIKSPSDGLYLIGTGTGTNEASLRITGNDDGYTDDVSVTYFQADYRSAHNLVFQSGTYGADAALARLMFNASCTQINGASYATAPVPTATLEVVGSSDQIQTKVKANATQTSNLTEWQDSTGTVLSAVSGTGLLGIGTSAPTHAVTVGTGKSISLYNTADQTTNYERVRLHWSSNKYYLKSEVAGTGSIRDIYIGNSYDYIEIKYAGDEKLYFSTMSGSSTASGAVFSHTSTSSSGNATALQIAPTINQSGSASYTALLVNPTETATGSGAKTLLDLQVGGSSKFKVDNAGGISVNGSAGVSGTFTSADAKTITVTNGIITAIV